MISRFLFAFAVMMLGRLERNGVGARKKGPLVRCFQSMLGNGGEKRSFKSWMERKIITSVDLIHWMAGFFLLYVTLRSDLTMLEGYLLN